MRDRAVPDDILVARISPRTAVLTGLALLCFAANSLLCRLALAPRLIDPLTFTGVRVVSAALMLCAIVALRQRRLPRPALANRRLALALLVYAVFFSLAYARLTTGTGALVLFGTVQLTMLSVALRGGERFSARSWGALTVAAGGLVALVAPGVTAPDPLGALFMAMSGVAWGFYSLLARHAGDPLEANANSFLFCIPVVLVLDAAAGSVHASAAGIGLAVASGALASGIGYVVWYAALQGLEGTQASVVQLAVPAVAAFGGVAVLAEPVSLRLLAASAAILGGVAVVLRQKSLPQPVPSDAARAGR